MFECKKRCGYCCTLRVKLGFFDFLRLWAAGHRDFSEKDNGKRYLKLINKDCVFLERKGKKTRCRVYEKRPKICRTYPFFNKQIKSCEELKKCGKRYLF